MAGLRRRSSAITPGMHAAALPLPAPCQAGARPGVRSAEACRHAAEATLPYSVEAAAHLLRACVVRRHVEQQLGQQQPRAQAVPQRQRRAAPLRRRAGRGRPLARRLVPCGAGLRHAEDAQAAPVRY